jgi:heat shock protein HtpX
VPLTFIDIEKRKSWRIGILFVFLMLLYFCLSLALFQAFLCLFPAFFLKIHFFRLQGNAGLLLSLLIFSIFTATIHFLFSAFGAVRTLMDNLDVSPPDPEDGIHRRLMNIMDEIHIATGDKRKIKCMVIPSLSMNALAVADLRGDAVIALTEGLLSRLTRPQLESVVAHEAYHILSGDCLETSIAASLFGMYASAMEKIQASGDEDSRGFHPAFLLFWILLKLSLMLSMFISREREYRADAASLRMTRNPLALAEALNLISRNWAGGGFISSGIEMLCIVNPQGAGPDDSEGFLADLMSTHPPIGKRIKILLKMARVSISELDSKARVASSEAQDAPENLYYALDPGHEWHGPYTIAELASLSWLTPLTWVSSGGIVEKASEDGKISAALSTAVNQTGGEASGFVCPRCRQTLLKIQYEETRVYQCGFCRGMMVENDKIPRIIARREKKCTERLKSLARAVVTDNQRSLTIKKLRAGGTGAKTGIPCSKCGNRMFRTFYSLAYLIEIDRCGICGITWFDRDELEMLQCIIENKITPRIDLPQF